ACKRFLPRRWRPPTFRPRGRGGMDKPTPALKAASRLTRRLKRPAITCPNPTGQTRKGVDYWLKAGLRCRARSAEEEAIGHLTKGIELIELLEESAECDALELPFQAQLGTAYLSTRGYAAPEVGPCFHRARALCDRVGGPPQRLAVLWGTWAWHVV